MAWIQAAADSGIYPPPGAEHLVGSWAWVLVPFIPLAAALLARPVLAWFAHIDDWPGVYGYWSIGACSAALALLSALWLTGAAQGSVALVGFVGQGLIFRATPASLLFALLATWLWLLAALYSQSYLAHGRSQPRYYFYFLLCLSGTLGVFLAGNFFTLFVFFEMVSLGAYPLVAHEETPEAMSAGRLYLYMSIAGGLFLLLGTVYLESLAGTTRIGAPFVLGDAAPSAWLTCMFLMLVGFAVKAGMFPLHVWLPRAHPVAPSPASALLSGVMIKTGAFGIYQIVRLFPVDQVAAMSRVLVPLSLSTMFLGAVLALFQTNAKRVLAYSSVSQIGYVLLAAAMAGILGAKEAMSSGGFAMHIFAHALFKAAMFLLVGVIYLKVHDLDITRIGPLGRRMPVTAVVFGVAVASIAGVPGFGGYPSKTVIHDAILILRHDAVGPAWTMVEVVFTIVSAMTVAYMAKLWYHLFLKRQPRAAGAATAGASPDISGDGEHGHQAVVSESRAERLLALAVGLPLLLIGLRPALFMSRLIYPFLAWTGYDYYGIHHLEDLVLFSSEPLLAAAIPLALGSVLFLTLRRLGFAHPLPQSGVSIEENVLVPGVQALDAMVRRIAALDGLVNRSYHQLVRSGESMARAIGALDRAVDEGMNQTARTGAQLAQAITALDQAVDGGINQTARAGAYLAQAITALDRGIDQGIDGTVRTSSEIARAFAGLEGQVDQAVSARRDRGRREDVWTLRNINVATLVMAGLIGLALLVFLFWSDLLV